MYILKYEENSDARCGSEVMCLPDIRAAQEKMQEQFQKTVKLLGDNFASEEDPALVSEKQHWASISSIVATIQDGIDSYSWEIIYNSDFVQADKAKGYVVVGCTLDSNGKMVVHVPRFANSVSEADEIMRKMYLDELQNIGLETIKTDNEEIEAGGRINGCNADIWGYTEQSVNVPVNVAHFTYFPIE